VKQVPAHHKDSARRLKPPRDNGLTKSLVEGHEENPARRAVLHRFRKEVNLYLVGEERKGGEGDWLEGRGYTETRREKKPISNSDG